MQSQWSYTDDYVTKKLKSPDNGVVEIIKTVPKSHYDLFRGALKAQYYSMLGELIREYTLTEFDKCESLSLALQESFPGLNADDLLQIERHLIAGNNIEIGKAVYREIEKTLMNEGQELYYAQGF